MSYDPPHPSYDPPHPFYDPPRPFDPPRPPYDPTHPPYGTSHPAYDPARPAADPPRPSRLTYPWQPAPPQPPRPERRPPCEPLGHHSDLRVLRGAYRWQRRTATLTALGYFTLFLILSASAPGVMTRTVADGIPAGLLLAMLQLPVTWLAIALYERTARRHVDPLADRIRKVAELDARRGAAR
ncbi:hypothetical protein AV521_22900 [Streptomyces sp. IMTB 2501]|uniref:DUF485 domain-containing protein n=1 Tax=Streptomyces sp. IMTB 2501 TaxID=1776340 RepID=UPI00096F593B|nr:DUF485 domain-containing protein [Streptomyces sp. IMTB 2501]OLZ67752.1 hypothetical protein AV521_22900 [Streptomyces sp. IMTB 2501]